MTDKDLKPCPFCGSRDLCVSREYFNKVTRVFLPIDARDVDYMSSRKIPDGHLIECGTCGARGPHIAGNLAGTHLRDRWRLECQKK
jgi:hypothetical protein